MVGIGIFKTRHRQKQLIVESRDNPKTLHENLDFTASEQYRIIRENLEFTISSKERCKVIGITSSVRGEGKSTTAINLSYFFAEKGDRVLLIDGDLRLPSIAKKMNIKGSLGFSDLLKGKSIDEIGIFSHIVNNWYILSSGNIPPNPSELIGSPKMARILKELKEKFDYIIIDLPPVNVVSDAISVSSRITGMVVVIREEYTSKSELENCFSQLKLSDVNIFGVIMNDAKIKAQTHDNDNVKYKRKRK